MPVDNLLYGYKGDNYISGKGRQPISPVSTKNEHWMDIVLQMQTHFSKALDIMMGKIA